MRCWSGRKRVAKELSEFLQNPKPRERFLLKFSRSSRTLELWFWELLTGEVAGYALGRSRRVR